MSGEMPQHNDSLSSLADDLKRLQTLRDQYSENLYRLKLRAAKHGVIDVPLPLEYEIAETESQLKELDREIAQLRHKFEIKIEGEEEEKQTRRQERDLLRNFWKIGEEEELFCAISTVRHEYTGKYRRRATGLGEIRGYASIVSSLSRAYEKDVMTDARLFFGDTFPQDDERLASSWILLGGDDKNYVTRLMMKQFEDQDKKLPFRFHYEKNWRGKETGVKCLFVQELEGKEEIPFIPQYEKAERVNHGSALVIGEVWAKVPSLFGKTYVQVVRDYGVVARLPNPLHPQSKLYIMAGCHTYGTAAAAKAVATKAILRQIEKTCPCYSTREFFAAVIRCYMPTENLVHIHRMEAFYPLDEKTLRPIPEGSVRGVDLTVPGDSG